MQLRFAALLAATVLVGLSVVFASGPVTSGSAVPDTATYVVLQAPADDCPWASSSAA
ncbi:hypothetical protein [Actinoplanes solisilvae]|uniref:hypothetical protein n=1 Tax=Actinoplanes solisilvae TaxID=2486853 RepID=UPI0013E3BDDD|nr:hypothetical protein [Actinoplanes solisilvae]